MGNHAISLATVGKTAEAAALLATAIESRRTTSSDPRALLVMLANLGDLHVSLERWVVAEASLRESIELPYARRACVVVLRASLAVSDCLLFTEAVSEEGRRQPSVSEFDRNNDEG